MMDLCRLLALMLVTFYFVSSRSPISLRSISICGLIGRAGESNFFAHEHHVNGYHDAVREE